MKRLSVIAVAVAAIMFFAIPAMAVDLDFSGQYRARGYLMENSDLDDTGDVGATNSFMDMRFRLQTVFQVHDALSLTVRFDAVDNDEWGASGTTVNFDRAYLTANFDMFDLYVGSMSAGTYGTKFLDSGTEGDRIKLVKNMDPYTLMFIYQKTSDVDGAHPVVGVDDPVVADSDSDAYLVSVQYKAEGIDTGILVGYTNDKTMSDDPDFYNKTYMTFNPYLRGTFGPVRVEAEVGHMTGDYRDNDTTADVDYDAWAYHLNLGMDVGEVAVNIGWAHTDGDDTTETTEYNAYGLGGNDWQPLLIATGYYCDATLGGAGNLNSRNGATTALLGYDIYYVTAAFSPMENVTLNAILADAKADEVAAGIDDDIGMEFDIGAKVKLMDNLTYNVTLAFFDPGDYWKGAGGTGPKDDSTYSMFHALVLTF